MFVALRMMPEPVPRIWQTCGGHHTITRFRIQFGQFEINNETESSEVIQTDPIGRRECPYNQFGKSEFLQACFGLHNAAHTFRRLFHPVLQYLLYMYAYIRSILREVYKDLVGAQM